MTPLSAVAFGVLTYMPFTDLVLAVLIGTTLAGVIVGAVQICFEELRA